MEVAALKKIGKGSTILLLDRNGGQSKAVAKQLRAKGFKRAFVVAGGFGGEAPSLPLPLSGGPTPPSLLHQPAA